MLSRCEIELFRALLSLRPGAVHNQWAGGDFEERTTFWQLADVGGELHTFGNFPIGGHFLGEKIICSYLVFLAVLIKNGHICFDIHVYV